jgi:hypothetical protein
MINPIFNHQFLFPLKPSPGKSVKAQLQVN